MIRTQCLSKAHAFDFFDLLRYKPGVFFIGVFLFSFSSAFAQAPTSLQYPATNLFTAHVSNVYLAPTLQGSTSGLSFTISPALPTGLSFNSSTGVISGLPTTASNVTYTVTATNSFGSTNTTVNISVSSTYFNNANGPVAFLDANRTFKVGNGQNVGDIAVYTNVTVLSGQAIDCIVKTVEVTNVGGWAAYDQPATAGSGFNNNADSYFSPQVFFNNGGGSVTFEFQFILGGSYNNTTKSGVDATLQNVMLNTYDIDGNGSSNSNQYNEFDGFSKVELSSATSINTPTFNATTGLTQFLSGTSANIPQVTADETRVRLTYANMSAFHIKVGAGATGAAYYFLDFSGGPIFASAVASDPPLLDLNTSITGIANGTSGCANTLPFTNGSQTNITSPTALTALIISYNNTAAHLPDGSAERLLINGATAGTTTHALNFTSASTSSVTVGGVSFTISKTVLGSTNSITFSRSGTFTVAQCEALIDALQYDNTLNSPTSGSRKFTINIRNNRYISPDALFTATLNCVTVTGNVYHDANGLTDNTVNPNSTMGQFGASALYVVMTNAATNAVIATVPIAAGGAFNFGRQEPGAYHFYITNTATPGTNVSASVLPAGNYKSTGENLGASAGNDGQIDSKLAIILGSVPVVNANLGAQIPPVTANYSGSNRFNPGGYNYYTVPANHFVMSDADGTVQSLTITAFPAGANYLKVGPTFYTNGGTCPPQVSCTAWPGTLTVPITTVGSIAVDPTSPGNTSVTINFTVLDNGNFRSNNNVPSTITLPFIVENPAVNISGTVWNDANGNGIKELAEPYTAAASSGETLFALLIQNTNTYSGVPTILASTPVSAFTGYTFSNVPSGNNYEIRIVSRPAAPVDGVAKSSVAPALATNYAGVSTNNNGIILANQNTNDQVNALGLVNTTRTNVHFGIERFPDSYNQMTMIAPPMVNSFLTLNGTNGNPPVLIGSDPEDQASPGSLAGRTVAITSLPTNGQLWYDGAPITIGNDNANAPSTNNPFVLTNYDPAKMQVRFTGSGYTLMSFTYAFVDAAGLLDPSPAPYILTWITSLPVKLVSFTGKNTGTANELRWTTLEETAVEAYVLERSIDGGMFQAIANLEARHEPVSEYRCLDAAAGLHGAKIQYRLKPVDRDGRFFYSHIVALTADDTAEWSVVVVPNPAKEKVVANVYSRRGGAALIRVTGSAGQTIFVQSVNLLPGVNRIVPIHPPTLANGVYVLSVGKEGQVNTQQFIVQH